MARLKPGFGLSGAVLKTEQCLPVARSRFLVFYSTSICLRSGYQLWISPTLKLANNAKFRMGHHPVNPLSYLIFPQPIHSLDKIIRLTMSHSPFSNCYPINRK